MKNLVAFFSEDLLFRHAQSLENGSVGGDDATVGIENDGGMSNRLEDRFPFPVRFFELFFGLCTCNKYLRSRKISLIH